MVPNWAPKELQAESTAGTIAGLRSEWNVADKFVVAYSGNELKGYGNLVLIRHPNGFVTAYAHASELLVKRGDTIKRGQIIGKAGQTGTVSSPQVHFEIRKGSSPVDPTQYLNGA